MDTLVILARLAEMLMYFAVGLTILMSRRAFFIFAAIGVGASSCITGSVRLIGGSNKYEGRVEVCVNKAWSSVCTSSGWNRQAAQIVCLQLGDNLGMKYCSYKYYYLLLCNSQCGLWNC